MATSSQQPEQARSISQNVLALYGVQAGRKLIPLVSIPYLARVLGPTGWGTVAFITAMAELLVICIEFGFNISATREVARQVLSHRQVAFRYRPMGLEDKGNFRDRIITGAFRATDHLIRLQATVAD